MVSYLLGFFPIPISTPWEINSMPAFAKDTQITPQVVRLPVSLLGWLIAASLVLSLKAGGLASYFMARRTAGMKPAAILRRLRTNFLDGKES